MSADKVYRAIGDAINATRLELGEQERRRVIIALCDAVREDEREQAVTRAEAVEVWNRDSAEAKRDILEAIRNA